MQQLKMPFLVFACCLYTFIQLCICTPSPRTVPQRSRRSGTKPGNSISLPLFNTTVLSADGTSKSPPKLQTKVYIRPSASSPSNLTTRQIMGERRILTCHSPTATFHHSHCRHMKGMAYSIREYMTWCREPLASGMPQPTFTLPSEARAMASSTGREDPSLHGDYGTCHSDEVCVDSLYSVDYRDGFRLIANCVKKQLFQDAGVWNDEWEDLEDREGAEFGDEGPDDESPSSGVPELLDKENNEKGQNYDEWEGEQKHGMGLPNQTIAEKPPLTLFSGKYASIVITRGEEGLTPLEVRKIGLKSLGSMTSQLPETAETTAVYHAGKELEAGLSYDDARRQASASSLIIEQEESCTSCVDLKTIKPFAPDTTALEMEVKMIGIGGAALAGVLWVALLSG